MRRASWIAIDLRTAFGAAARPTFVGLAMVVLASVAGCGGGGGGGKPAQKPIGPAVDEKQAEQDAGGVVKEIYDTLTRGKTDSLFSLLADPLIVFGPRKLDTSRTRSEALVAIGKVVDPKAKSHTQVRSGGLSVVASTGGHSAWAFDVVDAGGSPLVMTAVLTNDDDLWAVSAAALARTPSMREVRAELKKVAIVPPGTTAAGAAAAKVDDRAKLAVERFQRGLLDPAAWGEDLGSRTEAIVIGPAIGDVTRGKKEIKKLWAKRVEAETRAAVSGELAAGVTPDGQLAWVTAPVTRVEKDEEPLPLRVFAVFERDGASWKMIALHEALAIDAPGAGAEFVKVLPPAPKAAEPPPEPAKAEPTKAEPTKAKKTKKKKKKKKKVEDDEG